MFLQGYSVLKGSCSFGDSNSNCNGGGFNNVETNSDGNVNAEVSDSDNCEVNPDGNSNCNVSDSGGGSGSGGDEPK